MNIDVNGVKITLTKEQLEQIAAQTKLKDYRNIDSYEIACKVLGLEELEEGNYPNRKEYLYHKLSTIIEAVNSVTEGKKEYYPYFKRKSSGIWLVNSSSWSAILACPAGSFGLVKSHEIAKWLGNAHMTIFQEIHELNK